MYVFFNPSPTNSKVGDCVIRSICAVTGDDWDTVYLKLCVEGFIFKDMPSSNAVWGSYLANKGFNRWIIPNTCPNCYTVADFAKDHQNGKFILGTGTHAVAVIDGAVWDSWDSQNEIPLYYWSKEG